jgi:thioesterase domain-containing protein/acyl carrier protein
MQLEELPLTANGKVDRKRLPTPEEVEVGREYEGPRTVEEKILCGIWEKVLKRERVGVKEDFFEAGGHSMKAVHLSVQIAKKFGREIPVRLVFDKTTIEKQAEFLRGEALLSVPASLVPIRSNGPRCPLFCVHPFFGLAHCYRELSDLLGPDQPFYGLQSQGLEEGQQPLTSIPEMASFYLKAIRSVQPFGPYQLAGWSMGALIAYEIAQQLLAVGETTSFLGLLEGRPRLNAILSPEVSPPAEGQFPVSRETREKLVDISTSDVGISENESIRTMREAGINPYFLDGEETHPVPVPLSANQLRRLMAVVTLNLRAIGTYMMKPYAGRVCLFRVPVSDHEDESYGWSQLALGGIQINEISGTHETFLAAPSVNMIATQLNRYLASGQPDSRSEETAHADLTMP